MRKGRLKDEGQWRGPGVAHSKGEVHRAPMHRASRARGIGAIQGLLRRDFDVNIQ